MVKCSRKKLRGDWSELKCGKYTVQIKHFKRPSQFGINKGKISKLTIYTKQPISGKIKREFVNYDRGWDKRITKRTNREVKRVYDHILKRYN